MRAIDNGIIDTSLEWLQAIFSGLKSLVENYPIIAVLFWSAVVSVGVLIFRNFFIGRRSSLGKNTVSPRSKDED